MLGTVLIVILILALLGALPEGRSVEIGVITRPEEWELFFSSYSFFWCSGAFSPGAKNRHTNKAAEEGRESLLRLLCIFSNNLRTNEAPIYLLWPHPKYARP